MINKQKWQAGIFICLLVLWLGVIFHYSAQVSYESSQMSQGVSYRVTAKVGEIFEQQWSEDKIYEIAAKIEYPVRKAAHMTEYAILSVLWLEVICSVCGLRGQSKSENSVIGREKIRNSKERGRRLRESFFKKAMAAELATAIYAMTDEFHQLFVAGRDGNIVDVCIDSTGALIGILVFFPIERKLRKGIMWMIGRVISGRK